MNNKKLNFTVRRMSIQIDISNSESWNSELSNGVRYIHYFSFHKSICNKNYGYSIIIGRISILFKKLKY